MHIFKTNDKVIVKYAGLLYSSPDWNWDSFINRETLHSEVLKDLQNISANPLLAHDLEQLCTPIAGQEIWASGVTYLRSKDARMEESKDAGGGDFYARVYNAERPEIFFKSSASRAVGQASSVTWVIASGSSRARSRTSSTCSVRRVWIARVRRSSSGAPSRKA